MKHLLYISLLIVFICCGRENESIFKWSPLVPEADSIVLSLERELIKSSDPESLRPLVEKLINVSENCPDIKQLKSRAYYWKGKMYHKMEMYDSMEYWSDKSRMLMDSATYPYDCARLNLLSSRRIMEDILKRYIVVANAIDYARSTSDPLLEANALCVFVIIRTALDIAPDHSLVDRACELYSDLGLSSYVMKIKTNKAMSFLIEKDYASANQLYDELLGDPEAKNDRLFYTKVLFGAGLAKQSPEYMSMAAQYAAMGNNGNNTDMEMTCRWYIGHFYSLQEKSDMADSIYKSLLPLLEVCSHEIRANILYDNSMRLEREGKADSALSVLRMYLAEEDSLKLSERRQDMMRIETMNKLKNFEEKTRRDKNEERLKWALGIIGVLLVSLTVYVLISGKLRRERIRKQEVEEELDRSRLLLESEQRVLMSQGLAMTEKDNVLQSVADHVSRMEREGNLTHGDARKLDADIRMHLSGRQEWDDFREVFSKVHPAFTDELLKRYPAITEGDVRLAVYIKAGLSTKQIARMLMLQPSSVKMNRHRLRERMGLAMGESLEDALRGIELK